MQPVEDPKKLTETLIKPATVAITAGVLSYFLADGGALISTSMGDVMGWIPVVAGVGVASYGAEVLNNYVISNNDSTLKSLGGLLKPVATGTGAYVGLRMLAPIADDAMLPLFLLGASSELAGEYAYKYTVEKMMNKDKANY